MIQLISLFVHDPKLRVLVVLILLDFALGVCAAIKAKTFRLSYLADFLKSDIAGKLFPYALLSAGAVVAGDVELIPGVGFGWIVTGAFGVLVAALSGSALASLKELGLLPKLPDAIAGPEQEEVVVVSPETKEGR